MPFPKTEILDNFNRFENPLSNGGKWAALIDENKATNKTGLATGTHYESLNEFGTFNNARWTVNEYTEPGVAFEAAGFGGNEREQHIWANLTISGEHIVSGWKLICAEEPSGKRCLRLYRYEAEKGTLVHEEKSALVEIGDKYGLSFDSSLVRAWHKKGAGSWEEKFNASDGGFKKGWIGIGANGSAPLGDNFEASEKAPPPPSLENPGTQHSRLLKSVSLQIKGSHIAKYIATNLPKGLSINETSGLITGISEEIESTIVKLTAENEAKEAAKVNFEWIISITPSDLLSMLIG